MFSVFRYFVCKWLWGSALLGGLNETLSARYAIVKSIYHGGRRRIRTLDPFGVNEVL